MMAMINEHATHGNINDKIHATNSINEEGKNQSKEGGTSTNASVEEGASNSNKTNSYRGASNDGNMMAFLLLPYLSMQQQLKIWIFQ